MRPEEELYDVLNDPDCLKNLAGLAEFGTVKTKLRQQMEKELIEQGDPRTLGKGDVFDKYPYVGPKLDYSKTKN